MNTPHQLTLTNRVELNREMMTPVEPHFFLNPPLAREIETHYKAEILALLEAKPPGRKYYDDPALRLLCQQSPEVLPEFFEAWFSPDATVETLIQATQIVYETNHTAGIEKANTEIARRFQATKDPVEGSKMCHLANWDSEQFLPHVHRLLHRFPQDPKVVFYAVMCLDQYGPYEPLEIPLPCIDFLKSWLDSNNENERYIALEGLAHTPYRETKLFGDQIRARIKNGDGLYVLGDNALPNNPAPWVREAFADLQAGAAKQPLHANMLYKYGDHEFVEFYQTQILQYSSTDALRALRRVVGDKHAIEFLTSNLGNGRRDLLRFLLDIEGENAIPTCMEFLKNTDNEELHKSLIRQIVLRGLGKENAELLEQVEKVYRNACETDFRINAKQILNALMQLGHADPTSLARLLPEPDPFESPAVTMTENDVTIKDFVDFLNNRQNEKAKPIDPAALGDELDGADDSFALQCRLHNALLQSSFAMGLCSEDWTLDSLDALFQELVLLTNGTFAPSGIRLTEKLEISWKDTVFVDTLAPYETSPGGLVDMINAMLDHSGETTSRFVAYHNESGNEYPTIVFLSEADVKTFETRFGLKPNKAK